MQQTVQNAPKTFSTPLKVGFRKSKNEQRQQQHVEWLLQK